MTVHLPPSGKSLLIETNNFLEYNREMNSGFWSTLATPIVGLSPMDGITDHPYRYIQKKYGQPAVLYTEFTSVEGLCHGAERLLKEFLFDDSQRPIIGQIYGTTPEYFRQSAIMLCQLGFDGIDINMGCPAKNVAHSGAGAALIKTPHLAQDIIRATQQGVSDWLNGQTVRDCPDLTPAICDVVERRYQQLPPTYQQKRVVPVSIKTRVGYDQEIIAEWIPYLLEMSPAAIAIHGRTLKQHYGGTANWDAIGQAAQLAVGTPTIILGNGDVKDRADAVQKISDYGVAGALFGRATFGNPFVFLSQKPVGSPSIFEIALEHTKLYEATFSAETNYIFMPMRKHLGWYVREVPLASQIRSELFQTNTSQEVETILRRYRLLPDATNSEQMV